MIQSSPRGSLVNNVTKEELSELLLLHSRKHIATMYNVSSQSVYELVERWRLIDVVPLTEHEQLMGPLRSQLVDLASQRLTCSEIASRLGKSLYTVRRAYSLLNLKPDKLVKIKPPSATRSVSDDAILKSYQQTNNASRSAKELGVSCGTIINRLRMMGHPIHTRRLSVDTKTVLRDPIELSKMRRTKSNPEIAELLGCHTDTVCQAVKLHGIQTPKLSDSIPELTDVDWLTEAYNAMSITEIAEALDVSHPIVSQALVSAGIPIQRNCHKSKIEQRLADFVLSIAPDAVFNDRTVISPKELDIYIPSRKVAIEFNGCYWHSDKFKPSDYHLQKKTMCCDVGVRLVHIFEDDYTNNADVIHKKIVSLLGASKRTVYARKCTIEERDCSDLMAHNHIQGSRKYTHSVCLVHNGEIVAGAMFQKYKGDVELVRYATDCQVPGGMSRIISYFARKYGHLYDTLFTFADLVWSDFSGTAYDKCGMVRVHQTKPDYSYFSRSTKRRHNRRQFTKDRIKRCHPDVYDASKTELEMTQELGLLRVYDCGKMRYDLDLN